MAITTICSSPPTLKTIHPLLSPPPSSSSNVKFNVNLVSNSNEALSIIASATEAMALASAAMHAAREAVALARGVEEVETFEGETETETVSVSVVRVRRKSRRKKKTKEYEFFDKGFSGEDEFVKNKKSWYLSRKEEAEICLNLKEGARLEEARTKMAESLDHKSISKELAKATGKKRRQVDKILCKERESQERITRSYRRLVASIAAGYQGKGLSLQDLIQEGSIGLLRGAKRFDPERGNKLSTYVYWWIKQAMIRAIANKSRMIRLPGSMCEMVAKIAEANSVLTRRLRRLPTHSEIAEMLEISVSTVRLAFERIRYPISLDRAVTDRGCMTLQDIMPGPDETMPEKMVEKQLMKQELDDLLKTLTEREEQILRLYYGLNGDTPLSCEQIGKVLKLSRERVRQISGIALTKLQQTDNLNNLKVYIV
ncbi:RNA polymerase sigma factor sigD, chloroplastic [Pistacia vera]|uniref:RNA polymerase sigma factor sigD, chloroplastic n=1 Tax=Pistacia vera TaxID=55513 RepID=UPI001263E4B8|nr:RNA polymerase sigma factor sigD, chloroplastic [Pistacia vera]